MGYIGLRTDTSGIYRTIDDLGPSFNGVLTTFNLTFDGNPLSVMDPRQLMISINGVVQQPEVAFTTSGTTITFSAAPPEGATFWGVLLGGTYDVLNRELANTKLINGTYSGTFGPSSALDVMTSNTPDLSDSTNRIATTSFVRNRTIPHFFYQRSVPFNVDYGGSVNCTMTDGDLSSSNIITGQSWVSNEFTIPAGFYGLWRFRFRVVTGTWGGTGTTVWLRPQMQYWDGISSWANTNPIGYSLMQPSWAGIGLSAEGLDIVKVEANRSKFRLNLFQANSLIATVGFTTIQFEGYMIGG